MNHAIGRDTLNHNTYDPNCVAGNVLMYEVRLRLNQSATGPGKGTFVNTFTSLTGTFGADVGPAMAASSTWVLDHPISDWNLLASFDRMAALVSPGRVFPWHDYAYLSGGLGPRGVIALPRLVRGW